MATRSFLIESDIESGWQLLKADFPSNIREARQKFSLWLEDRLLARLNAVGDMSGVKPILVGSWARHELVPRSDIDLIFAGPEDKVKEFAGRALKAGLKLRSRTPESPEDWSVGVDPFDVLALRVAKPLNAEDEELVVTQRQLAVKMRRKILASIRHEREERRKRQDSISNYLEPNLKFGAGGLRDIEQALAVRDLFSEKFTKSEAYPFQVLETIKEEFLYLRSMLHLLGSGDILSAHDQIEIAKRVHMESSQTLMKFVQSELERANFYADWVVANAHASEKTRDEAREEFKSFAEAVQRVKSDPSILNQYQIRLVVDKLAKELSPEELGKALQKAVYPETDDAYLVALHRTRILEVLLPDLKRLKGLVQHDHYHRFTADAHLVQTLREVGRVQREKRALGVMSKLTRDLSSSEWNVLKLTALFHDLAKGRKGDHSSEGAKLVEKYFSEWGYPENLREDVAWMVENHLLISTAAFRQNPSSQTTWKRLFDRGVHGRRLILLALFTAIDIRATNPEAWTEWKAKLLLDLVENLTSPQAVSLQRHLKYAEGVGTERLKEWLLSLDSEVLQTFAPKILVEDLKAAAESEKDLPPRVLQVKKKLWVRFHRRRDETGTFLGFVKHLYGLGLNIQTSSVSTLKGVGVYDWFCLRTEKSAKQVQQWLAFPSEKPVAVPVVRFQSIDLMSQDEDEWIFSFRGRDQRGLLLSAAQALVEENLSLRWARAHTWGQQIDDIFSVQPLGEVEKTLISLRNRFVT